MAEFRKTLPASRIHQPSWMNILAQNVVVAYLFFAMLVLTGALLLSVNTLPAGTPGMQPWMTISYGVGLVFLGCGVWVYLMRRHEAAGRAFVLFAGSAAIAAGTYYEAATTQRFLMLWSLMVLLAAATMIDLVLNFPKPDPFITRFPALRGLSYTTATILAANTILAYNQPTDMMAAVYAIRAEFVFAGAAAAFSLGWLALRRLRIASPGEREQIRLVLWGGVLACAPLMIWVLSAPFWSQRTAFNPFMLIPLVLFPLAASYAIQHYRKLHTEFVISRVTLYGLLGFLVAGGYALIVSGLGILLTGIIPVVLSGLAIFALALVLNPIRRYLENRVDAIFFRGERAYQERVNTISAELTRMVEVDDILTCLRKGIQNSLFPDQLHIYSFDILSEQYAASADESGQPTSDLRFPASSGLVKVLERQDSALFIGDTGDIPAVIVPERARIILLGAQIYVPLPGRQRLAGWAALGKRLSGEPYSGRELGFIESLCDQAAVAIERAQVVVNMENRVREMNVLARVAQGINITLSLDDILELIYAQTSQVIPSDEFLITIDNRETGTLERIFYVENDDRMLALENKAIVSQSLEQEVIRQRRSIVTDDFGQECRKYGILVDPGPHCIWMGVPLNAGAETIGAMSLAKRDANMAYSRQQVNLLQAIADQAAGALIKARLLQETERRARQMASLNEIMRQLTSTLDLPVLLESILGSAVNILECQSGRLLLADAATQELAVQAAVGPLEEDWRADEGVSRLEVPLQVKERVIGAIEVVNKRDGSAFLNEDRNLLAAFAAQAAVAIENARLYTLTDQALAARVEELSVMQRIDRELNASLDVSRVLRITLDWAVQQSRAAAGLVGLVEDNRIRIMACKGYSQEWTGCDEADLPQQVKQLANVLHSEAVDIIHLDEEFGILAGGACSRILIPIRRETAVMGFVLLESQNEISQTEEILRFLLRLSDHAAIAISNAQLYNAVQSANVAKSEFVSFVSHELKNPMTSIKGYTELLASEAVGPITEPQSNFLNTIRSNVDRMSTLVSDLADVSRIEAGRLRLDFKAFGIKDIIDEVVRSMRRQVEEKNQALTVHLPELPDIWADRIRILQIVTNLVSNAHKYTPEGGRITAAAETSPNHWDPAGPRQVVHFWVADTGIGIAEEDQEKIFQKFFRSEDPQTREVTGTGLGLNITRSLVEMQGGRIWFESKYREGTTFHFTVPVAE
jgi:signal transduction histidine kinase